MYNVSVQHTLQAAIMDYNGYRISVVGLVNSLFPRPYFALVPGLCLLSAAGCDLLVLGFDLGYDLLHVQAAAVVHLHHHRGVLDAGLQLTQLLVQETQQRCGDGSRHRTSRLSTSEETNVNNIFRQQDQSFETPSGKTGVVVWFFFEQLQRFFKM